MGHSVMSPEVKFVDAAACLALVAARARLVTVTAAPYTMPTREG